MGTGSCIVHLQVVQWKSLMTVDKSPEEWSWSIINGRFALVMTDKDPAPKELMKVLKCNCHTNSRRPHVQLREEGVL